MNYYDLAEYRLKSSISLFQSKQYLDVIYWCCLSIELFLKSKLILIDHDSQLEFSHDVISIYKCLANKYGDNQDIENIVKMSRKYFNESRYPYITNINEIYDENFAKMFIQYVLDVKDYIDNTCVVTLDELQVKFRNKNLPKMNLFSKRK